MLSVTGSLLTPSIGLFVPIIVKTSHLFPPIVIVPYVLVNN